MTPAPALAQLDQALASDQALPLPLKFSRLWRWFWSRLKGQVYVHD